jgi:hypothetical protein
MALIMVVTVFLIITSELHSVTTQRTVVFIHQTALYTKDVKLGRMQNNAVIQ